MGKQQKQRKRRASGLLSISIKYEVLSRATFDSRVRCLTPDSMDGAHLRVDRDLEFDALLRDDKLGHGLPFPEPGCPRETSVEQSRGRTAAGKRTGGLKEQVSTSEHGRNCTDQTRGPPTRRTYVCDQCGFPFDGDHETEPKASGRF